MKDVKDYSLLAHNTFGIAATCRRFLEYASVEDARKVAEILTEQDQPVLIIGSGSNLLLTGDYPATVIHSSILGIRVIDRQELLNEGWITAADVTAEKTMDSLTSQEGKIFI